MSTSTLPPRFTFGPPDTLGNAIFYRYYPYQATLARWDRTSAEAAANPYTTRLQMLQQQLDTERAELMQMMRALSAGATPMELRLEAEQRAALARAGRRGGGGGGGGSRDFLVDLERGQRIIGGGVKTQGVFPFEAADLAGGGAPAPSAAATRFNAEAASTLESLPLARRAAAVAAYAASGDVAAIKRGYVDGVPDAAGLAAARNLVEQGATPEDAARIYGLPEGSSDVLTAEGYAAATAALGGAGLQEPASAGFAEDISAMAMEELRRRQSGAGRGGGRGAGGGGAAVQAVDPDKVLSDAEQLAVQRYIEALKDDGVATAEEYGEGFEAGKAAYTKAANLGEYTRVQAPYFNPEFLTRLGQVAQTKKAEEEQRGKFLGREERTPAEIEREQAKLFLESEMRAQGLVYLDPADYPDVAPWRLDTVPRAMRLLRDEGVDALTAPVDFGIKASPAEYGRGLANRPEVTADLARELARKKFKNDERADLALDYFFATKAAQQRSSQMTRAQQRAAEAATSAAGTPPPAAPPERERSAWEIIEDYDALEQRARSAPPPPAAPTPAPPAEDDIVFQPSQVEVLPPTTTSEMVRKLSNLRIAPGLQPEVEDALAEMAVQRLLDEKKSMAARRSQTVR